MANTKYSSAWRQELAKRIKCDEVACRLKQTGIDVVIGNPETHGRQQTEAKAKGFEVISPKVLVINGQTNSEMDVDAIIARHPKLVLIDITPETLEERLLEGKIYPLGKIEQDIRNFYQRCNLVTLRELALRQVANKIEQQSIQ